MQQGLNNQAADAVRPRRRRRTPTTLPGEMSPTTVFQVSPAPDTATFAPARTRRAGRRAIFQLLSLGVCLELVYLALYPLLAGNSTAPDPLLRSWMEVFPWLPKLYWTVALFAHIPLSLPWLSAAHGTLLLLGLAALCWLLAAQVGQRVLKESLSRRSINALFWTALLLSGLFALTMLFSPLQLNVWSQDTLLSWLAGRAVVNYHVNPYLVAPANFPHDIAQLLLTGIPGGPQVSLASIGPLWIDTSILVTPGVHNSVAAMVIVFRLIGLCAFLGGAALLWAILAKIKPEMRLGALLLYGWSPLALLFGVAQAHAEMLLVLLVLLAVFFLLRDVPLLGWFFVLLAALVNLSCLLLLPLFLRLLVRKKRLSGQSRRAGWWLGLIGITALVVVLAYLPYWQGWGWPGVVGSLGQVFLSTSAINSFDAAILNLPFRLPAGILWLMAAQHWSILLLVGIGCFTLFACWFIDTPLLLLVCCCWISLLFAVLQPWYWPWTCLLPFVLALCSAHSRTVLLTVLLTLGALLCYYCWLLPAVWLGQGLLTIAIPFLLWGWAMFFSATWHMTRAGEADAPMSIASEPVDSPARPVRPPWLSRPSWPSRPGRATRRHL